MSLVAFPDAESLVVSKIRAELVARGDTTRVGVNVPADRPNRLVRVTRTGGSQRDAFVDSPQITVQCWDTTGLAAANLSRLCRAVLSANRGGWVHDGVQVYRYQEVGGPAAFPDPDTNLPRYQFTCVLDVRGSDI